jgi:hypothetical protein
MDSKVDVLVRFISGKNGAVYWSAGMSQTLVADKGVLRIWERMGIRHARLKRRKCPV